VSTALSSFDKATAVERHGPGRFVARVDPAWDGPGAPLGGVVMATILRAMTAELAAADLAPRSVTAHFPRPLVHDLVEIQVETLRRGRRLATVQAHAVQQGDLRCAVLAAFGRPFPAVATWEAEPPAAPPPAEAAEVDLSTGPAPPHGQHLRFRPVFGPPPLLGGDQALAGGWLELRQSRPVDPLALCLFADAWWPAAWGRLRELVITPTVELTVHFRQGLGELPSGPVLARFTSRLSREGYWDEDGELWSADRHLLAQSRQLALLRRPAEG
jgi:Acyl-CoA thioesterase C-terminal domain/Acyl-CoA thioesterase N-terminal domain